MTISPIAAFFGAPAIIWMLSIVKTSIKNTKPETSIVPIQPDFFPVQRPYKKSRFIIP